MNLILSMPKRAWEVFREEGLASLIRKSLKFISWVLYYRSEHYLYSCHIEGAHMAGLKPKTANTVFKVVSTWQEVEALRKEGYDLPMENARTHRKLGKGITAWCVFAGRELGSITWVAMSRKARYNADPLPYEVDFENGEVCCGGVITSPKHRQKGLYEYGLLMGLRYLEEKGKKYFKCSANTNNKAPNWVIAKFNPVCYAEVKRLRILCWRFYRRRELKEKNGG